MKTLWLAYLLLQPDPRQIDVVLGSTGTFLLGLVLFALAVLNAVQFYKAKNVERLTSALAASEVERKVHQEASQRKTVELEAAYKQIGELQAKTDIQPLMVQAAELTKMAVEQMEMTRKFEREYGQTQTSIASILQKMEETDGQRYASAVQVIQSCVTEIGELRKEFAEDRRQNTEEHQGLIRLISNIEERMPKR